MSSTGDHNEDAYGSPFAPAMERIERADVLDSAGDALDPLIRPLVSSPRVRDALRGRWLGHALHPLLTDLPLGAWLCTSMLDVFGSRRSRPQAEGLLIFGLAAAVPTVLAGAAEWAATTGRERRVGTLHAGVNGIAAGLYAASLVARLRHRHAVGVGLGVAGGVSAIVGGYLGGHLTLSRNVGTTDPAFEDESGAAQLQDSHQTDLEQHGRDNLA